MQCVNRGEDAAMTEDKQEKDLFGGLRKIRESTGMNRKEFAEYFGIPYRTVTDWELGHRRMPDYLLRLIEYKIRIEKLERNKKDNERGE